MQQSDKQMGIAGKFEQATERWFGGDDKNDVIDLLKQDHRKVEKLFRAFNASKSAAEKRRLAQQISQELSIHTKVEEAVVYPVLAKEDLYEANEAYAEHSLIEFMIKEIAHLKQGDKSFEAKIHVLEELVKKHIKEEEHTAFPELKDSGVDLDVLGRMVRQRKSALMHKSSYAKKKSATHSRSKAAAPKKVSKPSKRKR